MSVVARQYRDAQDFWRIRQFLIETFPALPFATNWEPRRWDGRRFHHDADWFEDWATKHVRMWETGDGQLVGAVFPEGAGDANPQVHPDHRYLEGEMLAWAEQTLPIAAADGAYQVEVFALDSDDTRRKALEARGYAETDDGGVVRRMRLDGRLPDKTTVGGYVLRPLRWADDDESQRIADVLNAGFGRTLHNALEFQLFTAAPDFRLDLHLVAEAPDGSFGAFVGLTYDEANRRGIVEPVCTHPDHRRRGLAAALLIDGLHRIVGLGAAEAQLDTGMAVAANAFYESVGFTEAHMGHVWRLGWE
jgi:ribosomal protein S18 acetylase RimI-like enzyme